MPLPSPSQHEKQGGKKGEQAFISRCMADKNIQNDFKDQKQRAAVCYSRLREAKKKKSKGEIEAADWDLVKDIGWYII